MFQIRHCSASQVDRSVPDPLRLKGSRLSPGWFHRSSDSQDGRKEAPPGTEDVLVGAGEFLKHSSDSKINEEEKEFLSQYVNPK